MRQETVNIYKFKELGEEAKERAVDHYNEHNLDYEWWESVYDDAENIGIEITAFDDVNISGDFLNDLDHTIAAIIRDHGKDTSTCELARNAGDYTEEEFLYALLEEYRIMLRKEAEYLTSFPVVSETLDKMEYEFYADGSFI